LWDIAGKATNLPLYRLLGGYRDRIRAYASTLVYDTIDEYIELAKKCKEEGFTAFKIHVWGEPDKDIELCKALRDAFPDMDLMIDALCAYDRVGALRVGRVLDQLNFYWFESPLREAAHLHVMLSIKNCDFFESPVPQGFLDAGMKDVIRVQKDGYVYAPKKPGLGWKSIGTLSTIRQNASFNKGNFSPLSPLLR